MSNLHAADHFSKQADYYARYRPTYPSALFDYLTSLCREKKLAWDCATGNGQAAKELAQRFEQVYATDISEQQLSHAQPANNITYKLESVEHCGLPDASVDLITAATAAHWFDLDAYYKQVNRVLVHGGVLAIWSYAECSVNAAVDAVVRRFSHEFLKSYWPKSWQVNILDHYKSLPFPYSLIAAPQFVASDRYNLEALTNHLRTWSSVQRYIEQHDVNPITMIQSELENAWGDPLQTREVTWELFMKIGRKP